MRKKKNWEISKEWKEKKKKELGQTKNPQDMGIQERRGKKKKKKKKKAQQKEEKKVEKEEKKRKKKKKKRKNQNTEAN